MNLNILNLGVINKNQATTFNRNQYKTQPSFGAKCDVVEFSPKSNAKLNTVRELIGLGYSYQEAQRLVKEHFNSEIYEELTEGFVDNIGEDTGKRIIAHYVDIDRHLTPTEAILYIENDMETYYAQHEEWGTSSNKQITKDAESYEIGKANFSPCDLAKYMLKGFDIALSGMILKGKINEETARCVQKYYNFASDDVYENKESVKQSEYAISLIAENMDKIEAWISTETDENGELLTGFTRPLTDEESAILITNDYMPQDSASINKYIKLNNNLGYSLYRMEFSDLWDKDADELIEKQKAKEALSAPNVIKMPKPKLKFETLQEAFQYMSDKASGKDKEFFEDMAQLDDKKFRKLISLKSMRSEAMFASMQNRELRQKNIQVLNSLSDELLDAMTTDEDGQKHKFSCIGQILGSDVLEERVAIVEKTIKDYNGMIKFISREMLLDYLTDSDIYSYTKNSMAEFHAILRGEDISNPETIAKVIPFSEQKD